MTKMLESSEPIYINIPCPTNEEATKICGDLLRQDLVGTAKIYDHVHLMYTNPSGVQGEDVVIISLKTISQNLPSIHEYILKNHSWGTPCIEVVSLKSDQC